MPFNIVFVKRLIVSLIFLGALLAAHWFIIGQDLYHKIWWLDIVLHAIGGFWLVGVYRTFFPYSALVGLVFFVLAVGVIWEALEFFLDTPFFGKGEARFSDSLWQLDTMSDLAVDIGAALLLWWGGRAYNNKHNV